MKKKTEHPYSVDKMMRNLCFILIRDFQSNLDDPLFCSDLASIVKTQGAEEIRKVVPTASASDDVPRFKATYQMECLLKRYRFEKDLYSDQELMEKSIMTFIETQDRIRAVDLTNLSSMTRKVLDLARVYVSKVLGAYSDDEHRALCRFGSRASVGIAARDACEAARWQLPLTGSHEQITWFDSEMSQIDCVQEYWAKQRESDPDGSTYRVVSSLKLTLVPKTFKSLRSIMPNTTIGTYMSYGLGEMIRKRLARKGQDIRTLQMRHRYLAREASRHGLLATADLSSASDSISVALVQSLFPPDWFDILNRSRIGVVSLPNGTTVQSDTFCTMGVGYTFPLQTLVFLSLLRAIEATLFGRLNRRTISVYGDDLIYSSRMHQTVVSVFTELGFVINLDKTNHEGNFRESCGGDYFHGVDVRPFQPRNGSATVDRKTYEATLYKYINGLLMRWDEREVAGALGYLVREVMTVARCKVVPQDYPDDAGIKCATLGCWNFLQHADVAKPVHVGHGVYRFSYLGLKPKLREELRHEPYLWLALRGIREPLVDFSGHGFPSRPHSLAQWCIDVSTGAADEGNSPLIWREIDQMTRSKLTGRRQRRLLSYVTVSHTGKYTRQSGFSCFGTRRP